MPKPKRTRSIQPGHPLAGREWVGGRILSPFYITEGTPYRPELILWIEMPEATVVSFDFVAPDVPKNSFGETLLSAMADPLIGPPRRPNTIRIADAELAKQVRAVAPEIPIVQAPTPELYQVLEYMAEHSPDQGRSSKPSYFENGRVSAESIEFLFDASRQLHRAAPWKVAGDWQVLRVDIPEYEVEGGCLSIIGALDESVGLLLFPSLQGFRSFAERADFELSPGEIDLGTSLMSLTFEPRSGLPPSRRREIAKHGWSRKGEKVFPVVEHRDPDGVPRPISDREVLIMSACASALCVFFSEHPDLFEEKEEFALFEAICQRYIDGDDLEVRFTFPYEAEEHFVANQKGSPRRGTSASAEPAIAPVHYLERDILGSLERFARDRFGAGWIASNIAARDRTLSESLFVQWIFYHCLVEGKSIAQWYQETLADDLLEPERGWLLAQREAWLSIWEVVSVDPGKSLLLRDLLTHQTRVVWETSGSEVGERTGLLARVVDYDGMSVICGIHAQPLPPRDTALVVDQVRSHLRRKTAVPVERLRNEDVGRYLITQWELAIEEMLAAASRMPMLQNTDGDPLLDTVDHFAFERRDREKIERCLASAKSVEGPPGESGGQRIFVFTKPGNSVNRGMENTVIGRVIVEGGKLRIATNSIERADSMRDSVESILGSLIRHRAREHADPIAAMKGIRDTESAPSPRPRREPSGILEADDMDSVILEMKAKHYADWADHPLPALNGLTPRAAAKTKMGRAQVDLLLKESENLESRLPAGQQYDFSSIRRDLRLED